MQNCPSCESDQFKKATLVHAEGQSITVGVGAGVGAGGVGLGVGRGVTRSLVAETCSPPKRKQANPFGNAKLWQIVVVIVPGFIAFADGSNFTAINYFWATWCVVGILFLISRGGLEQQQIDAKHKSDLALYDKSYMCMRCGALSQPFKSQP